MKAVSTAAIAAMTDGTAIETGAIRIDCAEPVYVWGGYGNSSLPETPTSASGIAALSSFPAIPSAVRSKTSPFPSLASSPRCWKSGMPARCRARPMVHAQGDCAPEHAPTLGKSEMVGSEQP